MPTELAEAPEVPLAGEHLWAIFLELNGSRSYGMGENPITYLEIQAYCILTNTALHSYEVWLLKEMDYAFLSTKVADDG